MMKQNCRHLEGMLELLMFVCFLINSAKGEILIFSCNQKMVTSDNMSSMSVNAHFYTCIGFATIQECTKSHSIIVFVTARFAITIKHILLHSQASPACVRPHPVTEGSKYTNHIAASFISWFTSLPEKTTVIIPLG